MKAVIVFFLVLGLSYFLGMYLNTTKPLEVSSVSQSSCDISKTACLVEQQAGSYEIKFIGKPSALSPFEILLTSNDLNIDRVDVTFNMLDMKMGFNQYSLINDGVNWGVQVILPVCSLGKRSWLMKVSVKVEQSINDVVFVFNQ